MDFDGPRIDIAAAPVETYITFGPDHERAAEADGNGFVKAAGWVTIVAPSRAVARRLAFAIFGRAWAFDYDRVPTHPGYTLGETARITLGLTESGH